MPTFTPATVDVDAEAELLKHLIQRAIDDLLGRPAQEGSDPWHFYASVLLDAGGLPVRRRSRVETDSDRAPPTSGQSSTKANQCYRCPCMFHHPRSHPGCSVLSVAAAGCGCRRSY